MRTQAEIELAGDVASAIERASTSSAADAIVVITGSIYVVGEAMRALGVGGDGK